MIFSGKHGSNDIMKRIKSPFSARNKNTDDQRDHHRSASADYESMRIHTRKPTALNRKTQKKPVAVPSTKNDEFEKNSYETNLYDNMESCWLFSDCTSDSFFLEDSRLSLSFQFSVDERVVSWLSDLVNSPLSLGKRVDLFNRNRVKSEGDDHSVMEHKEEFQKEVRGEEKGSDGSTCCSVNSPETIKCSCSKQYADSTGSDVFMTPKVSFVSSNHVSEAGNVRSSGTESQLDSFLNSEILSSISCLSRPASVEEESCPRTRNGDEPLFWPLDQKFDWTPEDITKNFCMSPRRTSKANTSAGTSPSTTRQQFCCKRLDFIDESKRRPAFNPVSKDPKIPSTEINKNNVITKNTKQNNEDRRKKSGMKRINSLPSNLRKSTKTFTKIVPLEIAERKAKTAKEETHAKRFNRKSKTCTEDDFGLMEDFSIETLVGLDAFNGREGIDSNFSGDFFLFDDFL